MTILEKITQMVAGKAAFEKSESHAFNQLHERRGTAELLKNYRSAEPEATPARLSVQHAVPPTITSPPPIIYSHKSIIYSNQTSVRPPLSRSHSESRIQEVWSNARSTTGAPDVTARDLTTEELRDAYFDDGTWNPRQRRPPPLSSCRGIGRYRIAMAADPEFQLENLQKNLGGEPLKTVEQLAELKLGGSDEAVWQRFLAEKSSRSNSITSSKSSQSATSQGFCAEIDPVTGTRIVRGFVPSLPSSASNSFKEAHTHFRKDSGITPASITRNTVNRPHGQSQRHHSNRSGKVTTPSPLSTIRELRKVSNQTHRKIAKPCDFSNVGDPDSALASEDENESWVDLHEHKTTEHHPSNCVGLSRNIKCTTVISKQSTTKPQHAQNPGGQNETRRHNSTVRGLDRHKTLRASRLQLRRMQLKNRPDMLAKRVESPYQEDARSYVQAKLAEMDTSQVVVSKDERAKSHAMCGSTDNSLVNLGMWTIDIDSQKACDGVSQARDASSTSIKSNNSNETLRQARQKHETRRRRMRSGTAFRLSDDLR